MVYQPPPGFERAIWDDLLHKRNQHLLGEIKNQLEETEVLIVPWGAAHMPEIAREIKKSGFRLAATEEHMVIQFSRRSGKRGARIDVLK